MRAVAGKYVRLVYPDLTCEERAWIYNARYRFASIDELNAYRYGDVDVGSAVASTIVSRYINATPDLKMDENLVRRLVYTFLAQYIMARKLIRANSPGRVYLFNGRYAVMRAILRACESEGVSYAVHDRGSSLGRYMLYEDCLPHDLAASRRRMMNAWELADPSTRDSVADQFYSAISSGSMIGGLYYCQSQERGKLPESWNTSKRNVVIFTSSEDEFVAIGDEWKNPVYKGQYDALIQICESLGQLDPNIMLYIRMHPNQGTRNDAVTRGIRAIRGPSVEVIPPESAVSSYACLAAAEKVLTFGSTMGIEAVYYGKPSILVGCCAYMDLADSLYRPLNHREVMTMIAEILPPKSRDAAMIAGYYWATYGTPYEVYTPRARFEGAYRDIQLGSVPQKDFVSRVLAASVRLRRLLSRMWTIRSKVLLTGRFVWRRQTGPK